MPKTENEELNEHLENVKKTGSHAKQTDFHDNIDSRNENEKKRSSPIEKPQKGRGLRFLDSVAKNGSFIKKALKATGIGLAVGFGLALLFPPLGIAVMAISAIAGVAAIGGKVAYSYAKAKEENRNHKESTEPKAEILREIVKELMEEKLSKDKEETQQQEKKNGSKDDLKQYNETDNRREAGKSAIKNTNESGLAMFTKPLNSPNPDMKQSAAASKPKVQQKETQSTGKNMGMRRNTM
ncbi:hypothetical protein REB14_02240 [Chryseobacterium sp. ES2]|uniref:DUF2892 domain-containing protein n=1 Tax=Chryseobacterium metallicongregator TaxID=3073042 RepID=A0ABU1DZR5_9FLAO|nr:hypothetical protein [Chryseobacterium sp. ES2]MDR4951000.1 hypothetical protein [Chryseobacterium sp. ES2]